jgi:2-amino-4-hydroxy-6-hydroxymethyldihydropteridine diphosphokinase
MIHLNIGSNLDSKYGNRFDNISTSINLLINSKIKIEKISNFYETPSYPNNKFPSYLNIGLLVNYNFDSYTLLKEAKLIEKKIGRIDAKRNNPRVCDIDIIDFKGFEINSDEITLPHPRCNLRNFVLYPIEEIDPNWIHPALKKNVKFLINNLDQKSKIEITRLNKNVNIST